LCKIYWIDVFKISKANECCSAFFTLCMFSGVYWEIMKFHKHEKNFLIPFQQHVTFDFFPILAYKIIALKSFPYLNGTVLKKFQQLTTAKFAAITETACTFDWACTYAFPLLQLCILETPSLSGGPCILNMQWWPLSPFILKKSWTSNYLKGYFT
jgi:hypothetical protein